MRIMKKAAELASKDFNPFKNIFNVVDQGGSFKLLRIRTVADRKSALFRVTTGDGSFNYVEVTLARFSDGRVGLNDCYNYFAGEMISQTFRRIMIPLEQARSSNPVAGFNQVLVANLPTASEMVQAFGARRFRESVSKYEMLPQPLRDNKTFFLIYLSAIAELNDQNSEDWFKGVERFRELYPDDASLDLHSIDYYTSRKMFDQALKSVDCLEKSVGGDALLIAKRADILRKAGRYEESRKQVEAAMKSEPELVDAYWSAIELSLAEKKFAETLNWLKAVVTTCKVEIEDLEENEVYADFVKSPQYREWREWYQTQKTK